MAPGVYELTVRQLYLPPSAEPHQFTIDLSAATTGSSCLYRHSYPWAE